MHLAAGDHVDPGDLLVEDRGLACAVLGVGHGRHRQLPDGHEAVERLVPVRHAMRADYGGRVFWIIGQLQLMSASSGCEAAGYNLASSPQPLIRPFHPMAQRWRHNCPPPNIRFGSGAARNWSRARFYPWRPRPASSAARGSRGPNCRKACRMRMGLDLFETGVGETGRSHQPFIRRLFSDCSLIRTGSRSPFWASSIIFFATISPTAVVS